MATKLEVSYMTEKFFRQMMREKQDVYTYMGMYEMCSDTNIRNKLHAIASQECQHYKELYDIVFKEDGKSSWTPLETIIHHQAKEWYEDMLEELKKFK